VDLPFRAMGRDATPSVDVDINAPRRLRSGAIPSDPPLSIPKKRTAPPPVSFGLPPGARIGPPRGIPPTRPKPVQRRGRSGEIDTSLETSLVNDPFNLSARTGMAIFGVVLFIFNSLVSAQPTP
jgi:hypothetical protein